MRACPIRSHQTTSAGEPEAVDTGAQHGTSFIKYASDFQGRINDDIQTKIAVLLFHTGQKERARSFNLLSAFRCNLFASC